SLCGKAGEEIDLGIEDLGACYAFDPLLNRLDVVGKDDSQNHPEQGPEQSHRGAAHEKNAKDHPAGRTHGAQDRDVPSLSLNQHVLAGEDIEGSHQDDQRKDDEHHVPLHRQGVDDRGMRLLPVDDAPAASKNLIQLATNLPNALRILDEDLNGVGGLRITEKDLRLIERHVDGGEIEFIHADLEETGNGIGLHARHGADDGLRALGAEEGDVATGTQAQTLGKPAAGQKPSLPSEVRHAAGDDLANDLLSALQVFWRDALYLGAHGTLTSGHDHLRLYQGRSQPDALQPLQLLRDIPVIVNGVPVIIGGQVAIHPQDPAHQLDTKAVHHRHDDDERRDPDGDPEEGKDRYDRNEAFLPARP